jgi:anti-sigma regulatory factor (Ser/Thr protein kinase)
VEGDRWRVDGSSELALRSDLSAVRRARSFARQVTRGLDVDADAVELLVAELVTNAVLHGVPPITLRIETNPDRVHIAVADASPRLPLAGPRPSGGMTGRGLGIVEGLSARWGAISLPEGGKLVWADLAAPRPLGLRPHRSRSVRSETAPDPPRSGPDATVYTIRLGAVPTDLLLEAKAHIDNIVREFTLAREGALPDRPLPGPLARLMETVTHGFAEARGEIKRQALAAAQRGDAETELVLTLPASAADSAEAYLAALDEADRYAQQDQLLTLATPPLHRAFRRWYLCSLVDQLRARSRGAVPPATPTFAEALGGPTAPR